MKGVTNVSFVGSTGWILVDPEGLSAESEHTLMFRTTNGGLTWTKVAESAESPSPRQLSDAGVKNGMVFVDKHGGFVAVGQRSHVGTGERFDLPIHF